MAHTGISRIGWAEAFPSPFGNGREWSANEVPVCAIKSADKESKKRQVFKVFDFENFQKSCCIRFSQ